MTRKREDLPDIGEAWIAAVEFNGPIDPALIKLKHASNVKDLKQKREQEFDPHGSHRLAGGERAERDRKESAEHTRTLTWLLATDRAYAARHARALQTWRDTEDAADDALQRIEAALTKAREQHDALLNRAPVVGGMRVFRDDDGSVWTEDDEKLPDEIAAGIEWQDDEPSRSEFKAGQARIDELTRSADRVRVILPH